MPHQELNDMPLVQLQQGLVLQCALDSYCHHPLQNTVYNGVDDVDPMRNHSGHLDAASVARLGKDERHEEAHGVEDASVHKEHDREKGLLVFELVKLFSVVSESKSLMLRVIEGEDRPENDL